MVGLASGDIINFILYRINIDEIEHLKLIPYFIMMSDAVLDFIVDAFTVIKKF